MGRAPRPWLGLALLAVGACTFPSVTFRTDGGVPLDAPAPDAPAETAADAPSVDSSDPCDKDGDTFRAEGPPCNGNDCDDNDNRAYPGEPLFLPDTPTAKTMGDWDCDGVVDYQYPRGFSCMLQTDCMMKGFSDMPGCGQQGTLVTCKSLVGVVGCQTDQQTPQLEGCR